MSKHMKRLVAVIALSVLASMPIHSQCDQKQDHRSNKNSGILIDQIVVTGTQAIDSAGLSGINATLVNACFDENKDDISRQLLMEFQERGYLVAKVNSVSVKALDPLAVPKPVKVEAEVVEGPIYRISEIQFEGNRAFTSEELRDQLPIKTGDVFTLSKLHSGLGALSKLYGTQGYIDYTPFPQMPQPNSNGTVVVKVSIQEGKQYRMGKFEIIGQSRDADILRTRWSMPEGAVYDSNYPEKFIEENHSLLPDGFNQYKSVLYSRNCKAQTVALYLVLENRPDFKPAAAEIDCKPAAQQSPKSY